MKLFYISTSEKTNKQKVKSKDFEFLKRKEKMVLKDFDTAFSCYDHLNKKIISLRQWYVTTMIAFMVLFLSNNTLSAQSMFALVTITSIFNSLFELRELGSMRFNKKQILYLEKIFSNPNTDEYWESISNYEFRDIRLSKMTYIEKITRALKCFKRFDFIFWYLIWFFLWLLFIFFKSNLPQLLKSEVWEKISLCI